MFFLLILTVSVIGLTYMYLRFQNKYQFWKNLNVNYLEPVFPTGNVKDVLKSSIHFGTIAQNLYTSAKKHGKDFVGIYFFGDPVLLVISPEFAKTILVKDFNYFVDRGVYSNEKDDPLSANLFFMEGQRWKTLRAKLTPTFTSGKLKQMFLTILEVADKFEKFLTPIAETSQDIEIRDVLARFMTDVIGSCAFGLDCNSLENPDTEFRYYGKRMINFPKMKALKIFFAMMFRSTARKMGIRFNDEDVSDFFTKVVKDTIAYRENSGAKRKDFMQLLIDLKIDTAIGESEGLTLEEISAQAFVFFFAGFETSSTTLTFALHTLSHNQEIQEKARKTIKEILDKHNGEWTYDSVMEMNYIGQIIDEILRIYPPVASIHRMTVEDYRLPNGSILPAGTGVLIPNLGFQRDPDLFPNPMIFDPSRFSDANKQTRHAFSSLPFGEGPRICIGMRFGLLQTRLGLAKLLNNFRFNVCDKTDNPIIIDTVNLLHGPAGKVWLNIEQI